MLNTVVIVMRMRFYDSLYPASTREVGNPCVIDNYPFPSLHKCITTLHNAIYVQYLFLDIILSLNINRFATVLQCDQ